MVSVYRDPEGKNVFSKSIYGSFPSIPTMAGNKEQSNNSTMESQFALSKCEPHISRQPNKSSSHVTPTKLVQNQQHSSNNNVANKNGNEEESRSTASH